MYAKFGKRSVDIALASVALIVLAVPMLVIALWIRLDSHGSALFKQKRYGRNKQPFTIYKFRSMATTAPANQSTAAFTDSHSYITRAGRIARKLSLDELPQFYNVLRGDMSLIGPRPVVLQEKALITLRENYNANSVRPGISGWAQANGRDEIDDITKAELDGYYVKNFGFRMDLKVILKTLYVIVSGDGHAEGHEQVESAVKTPELTEDSKEAA